MLTIGIDPGRWGGLAWVRDGKLIRVRRQPMMEVGTKKTKSGKTSAIYRIDLEAMHKMTIDIATNDLHHDCKVFVEMFRPLPGRGSISSFLVGSCLFSWEALCHVYKIPTQRAVPTAWKRHYFGSVKTEEKKSLSLAKAIELFGDQWAERFARPTVDDGLADASLIALYGETLRKRETEKEEKKQARARASERRQRLKEIPKACLAKDNEGREFVRYCTRCNGRCVMVPKTVAACPQCGNPEFLIEYI